MDSFEKFEESLPTQNKFESSLKDEKCTDEDYAHVKNIWSEFNLKNLGDLCDLYVQSDVLLLADIVSEYRRQCWDNFQLDPLHYYTAPGLTWDACLKMTGVKIELLKDPEKYQFCELAIRGGVSAISKRFAEANNKDLPNYDPTKKSNYLWYIDANNLYGKAMVSKMPIAEFEWSSLTEDDVRNYNPDGDYGYFVECDITIPDSLHSKFNDYPIAPEPLEINETNSSPKSLEIRAKRFSTEDNPSKRRKIEQSFSSVKLAPNLYPKTKYICHIKNLQFYLQEGAVLTNIHRVLKFRQEAWIAPYIMHNPRKRQLATNEFQRSFWKLLNNSFYGKCIESVRKRVCVRLIKGADQQKFQTSKPGFKRFQMFDENLVGVELTKPKVVLDKPIAVGVAVLEISKLVMMDWYYRVFKVKFPEATLCFSDTDSFLFDIPTDNLYRDILDIKDHLDLSNFSKDSTLYDPSNKACLGKFKDECAGKVITCFVGLRSKCYSLMYYDPDKNTQKQKNTAAGVKMSVKKTIKHEQYLDTLFHSRDHAITQNSLRSQKHVIYSVKQTKCGLTAFDNKRWLLEDSITTRAHGHYLNK